MKDPIRRAAILAPLIFIAHVAEEAPGFVAWFNSMVSRGITQSAFMSVNVTAFVITVGLAGAFAAARERVSALLMLGWLGLLMFANAIFHIVATLVHATYCPGVVTATVLYLPFFLWFFRMVYKKLDVPLSLAVLSTLLGSIPMSIHGYLIVFRGDRLF
jgi:hypothetical protein